MYNILYESKFYPILRSVLSNGSFCRRDNNNPSHRQDYITIK